MRELYNYSIMCFYQVRESSFNMTRGGGGGGGGYTPKGGGG